MKNWVQTFVFQDSRRQQQQQRLEEPRKTEQQQQQQQNQLSVVSRELYCRGGSWSKDAAA